MYSWPNYRVTRSSMCDEVGLTIQPTSGPAMTGTPDSHIFVNFWALQFNMVDTTGAEVAGFHLGPQWANDSNNSSLGYQGRINFGAYDTIVNPGTAVCRGSIWNASPYPYNFDASGDLKFSYNTIFKFRVGVSPKQNWTAAELDNGSGQNAGHTNTAQQTDEYAVRMWMKIDNGPWFSPRDVLVKKGAGIGSKPFGMQTIFTEIIFWDSFYSATAFPYNPTCLFRDLVVDGRQSCDSFNMLYAAAETSSCDITMVTSGGVDWIQHKGQSGMTRTTPDNTNLNCGSNFNDFGPANVAINNLDTSTRVTTPRPWY